MKKLFPSRLKEIYEQVNKMEYSTDNLIEIISLFKESIKIAKGVNPHINKNSCLHSLKLIKDSEYSLLKSKEIDNEEDRKRAYKEFKFVFLLDFKEQCL